MHRLPLLLVVVVTTLATVACVDVSVTADGDAGTAAVSPGPLSDDMVPPPSETAWTGTVDHVTDGDTLWLVVDDPGRHDLRPGEEVKARLLRIDTPELARDGQPAECLADAASGHLADLVPVGTTVTASYDVEARDQYGRDLVHLWRPDGLWVNGAMLRDGFATVVTFPPNVAFDDQVRALESAARRAGAGLWSAC